MADQIYVTVGTFTGFLLTVESLSPKVRPPVSKPTDSFKVGPTDRSSINANGSDLLGKSK